MSPGDMNVKKTLPRWGRSDPSNNWGQSSRASAALPARATAARRAGRAVGVEGPGGLGAALRGGGISAVAQAAPAPGVSARVDAIRKAGALRVGVVNNPPWLAQNTSGAGEPWSGPSWTLGKEFARLLGVQIQPVVVSHETKVP